MPESRNGPRCRLIVFGAGGHAKVVIDAAERSGRFEVAGILDDNPASWGTDIFGYRVIGNISSIRHHGCEAIVAIGSNYARERIGREFANRGIELATIVHPRAQLSRGVRIGSGTVLMAGSIVNADTCLGSAVIINTGATVDHDCRIGNAVHIAPGVTICGGVMMCVGGSWRDYLSRGSGGRRRYNWSRGMRDTTGDRWLNGRWDAGPAPLSPPETQDGQVDTMMHIPMSSPDITSAEVEALNRVLAGSQLSIGPNIDGFERAVSSYLGVRHAVGVSSGTSALHLAVIAAGVRERDLVITTPFSFVASANCVLYERAFPIFVDVDSATGNIDPALVVEAADDFRKGGARARRWLPRKLRGSLTPQAETLKAILPVHVFGQPADMDPLLEVARRHGFSVIEDSCEAIGAEYKGRKVGVLGDAGVFAFYPNKQMTTGEGGMLVTDRDDWNSLFRSLRNQGRDVFDAWLSHTRLGYNYRLDELSAALGWAQMERIDELLDKRHRVVGWYNERLAGLEEIETPKVATTTTRMSWFVYVVRFVSQAIRCSAMAKLRAQGIPSRPYFSPIHIQPFYIERFGYQLGDFPRAELLGEISLALPFSSLMTEDQVDLVCACLIRALR